MGNVKTFFKWFTEARKVGVYVATIAATLLSLGVVPDPWNKYLTGLVVALGAVGIFAAENTKPALTDKSAGGP